MPLIVVSFMLFVILLTTTGEAPVMERMKTGTNLALSMCSALFFVVVFAHIGVRQRVSGEQIFYLEYFYFLMYVLLLCVALSAILFVMNPGNRFFQHRHNLISKLLYWPVALGLLFASTLMQFY